MPRRSTVLQEADALERRIRFEIGRDIRAARLDSGVSMRRASARVGMSHTQLGRIERGQTVPVRTEVPMPLPGDRRAWDAVIGLEPEDVAVEAEARLRDVQALDRRCGLKLRDSGMGRMVLLVADTPHNRRMLELHREDLRASFPLDTRQVMASLRAGRTPEASGIVVLQARRIAGWRKPEQ